MSDTPKSVVNLNLYDGPTTERVIAICEGDQEHAILEDSWARWDALTQSLVHEAITSDAELCAQCDSALETAVCMVGRDTAVKTLIETMQDDVKRLEEARANNTGSVMVCKDCGSQDVLLDAHSEYFATLDRYDLVTTYDKGHFCKACEDQVRVETQALSNHQILALNGQREAAITELRAEIAAVQSWSEKN